ncbi:UNVERIFIED_CONTAM: hypothetical protein FKN15_048983 [Acipenser sinensis]
MTEQHSCTTGENDTSAVYEGQAGIEDMQLDFDPLTCHEQVHHFSRVNFILLANRTGKITERNRLLCALMAIPWDFCSPIQWGVHFM